VSAMVLEHRGRGRPPCCPRELAVRVIHLQAEGLSYEGIAALLNAEGVPTPGGGTRWLKSSVDRLLHTRYAEQLLAELAQTCGHKSDSGFSSS
jgi:Recombinase